MTLLWAIIFWRVDDPKSQATKTKIDKWDYTNLKLVSSKGNNP
jgi:hypothetical protein